MPPRAPRVAKAEHPPTRALSLAGRRTNSFTTPWLQLVQSAQSGTYQCDGTTSRSPVAGGRGPIGMHTGRTHRVIALLAGQSQVTIGERVGVVSLGGVWCGRWRFSSDTPAAAQALGLAWLALAGLGHWPALKSPGNPLGQPRQIPTRLRGGECGEALFCTLIGHPSWSLDQDLRGHAWGMLSPERHLQPSAAPNADDDQNRSANAMPCQPARLCHATHALGRACGRRGPRCRPLLVEVGLNHRPM